MGPAQDGRRLYLLGPDGNPRRSAPGALAQLLPLGRLEHGPAHDTVILKAKPGRSFCAGTIGLRLARDRHALQSTGYPQKRQSHYTGLPCRCRFLTFFTLCASADFVQQVNDESGLTALLGKGPISYYCGFDPTASSLHVGSMIPLMALAHLARGGHHPIAVLGGGTAMVGDPSGKTELRQMLTVETIQDNRDQIEPQVRRFLGALASTRWCWTNAEWLAPLNYLEFLRDIGRHFSVNRMLAAEAYRLRLEKGLSFIEFNYQLLQAYDYLVLFRRYGCMLQIGGDDQWGNILAGTDLVRRLHQTETYALTFPLITHGIGRKKWARRPLERFGFRRRGPALSISTNTS